MPDTGDIPTPTPTPFTQHFIPTPGPTPTYQTSVIATPSRGYGEAPTSAGIDEFDAAGAIVGLLIFIVLVLSAISEIVENESKEDGFLD